MRAKPGSISPQGTVPQGHPSLRQPGQHLHAQRPLASLLRRQSGGQAGILGRPDGQRQPAGLPPELIIQNIFEIFSFEYL